MTPVPWARLLTLLLVHATPDARHAACEAAVEQTGVLDVHRLCARLVGLTSDLSIGLLLVDDVDDIEGAIRTARRTAYTYETLRGRASRPRADDTPADPTEPPGLHVEVLVVRLPLMALAHEVATHQPNACLVIRDSRLSPGVLGSYRPTPTGGVITLDTSRMTDEATLQQVFAHELAHAIEGAEMGTHASASERWAETLGPLLIEHRPASLDEAAPLIDQARAAHRAELEATATSGDDDLALLLDYLATDLTTDHRQETHA